MSFISNLQVEIHRRVHCVKCTRAKIWKSVCWTPFRSAEFRFWYRHTGPSRKTAKTGILRVITFRLWILRVFIKLFFLDFKVCVFLCLTLSVVDILWSVWSDANKFIRSSGFCYQLPIYETIKHAGYNYILLTNAFTLTLLSVVLDRLRANEWIHERILSEFSCVRFWGWSTTSTKSSKNGATTLYGMTFSQYVGHVTIFGRMLTIACCLVPGLGLRLGLDLVSGW